MIEYPEEHSISAKSHKYSIDRSFRPKKSLGQHFLVDRKILSNILEAAEISQRDFVIEIGPGKGFLTRALVKGAGNLVVVELSEVLASSLHDEFKECPDVKVVKADAREIDICDLVGGRSGYKFVANLPYYAASPIVRRFLEADCKPECMVVMVQREVAREMVAMPGKMGILSVATQVYGRPRIVCYVPPRAFRPAPKVISAVVKIDVYPEPAIKFDSESNFFRLVRGAFRAPRKQLRNSLSIGLGVSSAVALSMLIKAGIDSTRRAQTLSLEEWSNLYQVFNNMPDFFDK